MKNPIEFYTGRLGNKLFQYAYLYAQVREGIIKDVYVQDYRYFEKYADEIKQLFGEGIGYLNQVGVHIRRGKNPANPSEPAYHENSFYVDLCKTDYYEKAMAIFPEDDFLVFSDESEWAREKFKDNKRVQVMDKGDDVEDFNLYASTKHQIIANSSWSWWGGFLCPNEGHRVIAPIKWFADGIKRVGIPESWIQI